MFKLTPNQKAVIGRLVAKGHDLFVDGDGWHFDDVTLSSFKQFWVFIQKQDQ